MLNSFLALSATNQSTTAARHDFIVQRFDRRLAHGTVIGKVDLTGIARASLAKHRDHLGDHVAGSANHHRITHSDTQALNFVAVV